jgi:Cu/Zn superoxide dismutase
VFPHPTTKYRAKSQIAVLPGDDMKTDPAGNSRDRIACGLIVE